jgi:predicted Zn finger-like uncharacterized protein
MIVSCPQCASRYRIRDDKIQGAGARITCPECKHRFVIYRESSKFVVGGSEAKPKGLPVTFARKGQIHRAEVHEEDEDESDAPTTLMPHGSALAEQFRQSIAEERRRILAENKEEEPAPLPPAEPTAGPDKEELVAASPKAAQSPRQAPAGRPSYLGRFLAVVMIVVALVAVLSVLGIV